MSARWALRLTAIALALSLPMAGAAAAGTIDPLSPPNAYTVGNGLARSSGHLQAVWASDCPPPSGRCARDNGPYAGVFWQRSRSNGWSSPQRLSPSRQHAARPAVAAAGSDVYAAFVTQTRYIGYTASARRVLYIRTSTNEGRDWNRAIALSPLRHRVDYPVIAASGSNAWVVWTDADSGDIRMAASTADGATWNTKTIGSTTSGQGTAEGFRGFPSIGASAANVAVIWIADPAGRTVALASYSGGTDWSSSSIPIELTPTSPSDAGHYPSARGASDGASSRVAMAFTTDDGLATSVFDGVLVTDPAVAAGPWTETVGGRRFAGAFGPAIQPYGTTQLALAWAACERRSGLNNPCKTSSPLARVGILERESTDDGSTWSPGTVAAPSTKSARINEAPSIDVDAGGTVSLMWLRRMANWSSYGVYLTQP